MPAAPNLIGGGLRGRLQALLQPPFPTCPACVRKAATLVELGTHAPLAAMSWEHSDEQQGQLIDAVRAQIARETLPERRSRSCQRHVRQPVRKWPRMIQPRSCQSPPKFDVAIIA